MRLALRVAAVLVLGAAGIGACSDEFSGVEEQGDAGASSATGGSAGETGTGGSADGGERSPAGAGSEGLGGDVGLGGDTSTGGTVGVAGAGGGEPVPSVSDCSPDSEPFCRDMLGIGSFGACALASNGRVKCWGLNQHFQLGDGLDEHEPCAGDDQTRDCSTTPVVAALGQASKLASGEATRCALNAAGQLYCWGLDLRTAEDLKTPTRWGASEGTTALSLRLPFGLLPGDGTVWIGGLDIEANGVYGSGAFPAANERRFAAPVTGLTDASAFDVGWYHSCAVREAGGVVCWGKGVSGELGNGSMANSNAAVAVKTVAGASSVAVGDGASCARLESGAVWCWGIGTPGGTPAPTLKAGLANVIQLAGGFGHFCALTSAGKVLCWGRNAEGQTGAPLSDGPSIMVPRTVEGLNQVVAIGVGVAYSCALQKNGALFCWGSNTFGQLGTGDFASSSTPRAVKGL